MCFCCCCIEEASQHRVACETSNSARGTCGPQLESTPGGTNSIQATPNHGMQWLEGLNVPSHFTSNSAHCVNARGKGGEQETMAHIVFGVPGRSASPHALEEEAAKCLCGYVDQRPLKLTFIHLYFVNVAGVLTVESCVK